ncbi:dTDP-4-dehydrorhamnose 3,5-epimerase [Oceanospirillum maris]|jgi:dTDP-4-dehydrorhamnose 3,5-epimerase|uniref:dTDP-4-dehydrorhamnose 3,5-epimerase n=1 Tax=Oceanospirillum maris TaxID=64977 RepID=UPI00042A6CBD|nr:dTDP-4-dehydrorhamnose 3,5-epimerase [Oceanospirillum maris]
MKVTDTLLDGVKIIEPDVYGDSRGFFKESFNAERYQKEAGIDLAFVQDNYSRSSYGVLRGLHYQQNFPQGKLVSVLRGSVFDVAVDINPNSPTFGRYVGVELSDENHKQLWIPPGYAHGFCVLSESADFFYKCTEYYHPEDEAGVAWDCGLINIPWPITEPILSEKDQKYKGLSRD